MTFYQVSETMAKDTCALYCGVKLNPQLCTYKRNCLTMQLHVDFGLNCNRFVKHRSAKTFYSCCPTTTLILWSFNLLVVTVKYPSTRRPHIMKDRTSYHKSKCQIKYHTIYCFIPRQLKSSNHTVVNQITLESHPTLLWKNTRIMTSNLSSDIVFHPFRTNKTTYKSVSTNPLYSKLLALHLSQK